MTSELEDVTAADNTGNDVESVVGKLKVYSKHHFVQSALRG